jgi:hypothetical protein
MNDQSITQVDVRKVVYEAVAKGDKEHKEAGESATEIAKYAAKDEDYLVSQSVFDIFYKTLRGRQGSGANKQDMVDSEGQSVLKKRSLQW